MPEPTVTVIIPTFNRRRVLERCLQGLEKQTYPISQVEVIIVDDGSTDGTEAVVDNFKASSELHVHYHKQRNSGPAVARNYGIQHASGDYLIIIGDDIIASQDFISHHIIKHESTQDEIAVIGRTIWAEGLKITNFMKHLDKRKSVFAYDDIPNSENVPYSFFYTCNISVKKQSVINCNFDEEYRQAIFEDIELGYRLSLKGVRLVYSKEALGYHDHSIRLKPFLKRAFWSGYYSILTQKKHPEFFRTQLKPDYSNYRILKNFFYAILVHILSLADERINMDFSGIYDRLLDYSKSNGMLKGKKTFSV